MTSKKRLFGELELSITEAIRMHGPLSVKEVMDRLGNKDQYTTIMTVLVRLFKKNILAREKRGKSYIYSLKNREAPNKTGMLEAIKNKIFGGSRTNMVAFLMESDKRVDQEEIQHLEQLIDKLKKEGGYE